jgi:hypothetical protein
MRDRTRVPKSCVTTRQQDRTMALSHLGNRGTTAVATPRMIIGNHQRYISAQTMRNRLREVGLRARRPFVGVVLTQKHRQIRLQWTRRHLRFTGADLANVLFTDETRFNLRCSDGRLRVYRRRGEMYSAPCVKENG